VIAADKEKDLYLLSLFHLSATTAYRLTGRRFEGGGIVGRTGQ